jgi:UDP-N-acetylglucosamine diphosphorylase/glucosamine-1-phosphate N-acetyltransferase
MKVILEDRDCRDDLYPFTLTRSAADIRSGILTFREKWELITGKKIITTSELSEKELEYITDTIPANLIPSATWLKKWKGGKNGIDGKENTIEVIFPFHIFLHNDLAIREDYELLTKKRRSKKISSTNKISGDNIFIEEGAVVEHSILNSTTGPIYIGKNARVLEGCMIRGPFALCGSATLKMGTKVYGATTIGPHCVAGGEIKNSVMFGYSNKSHDGYLGDSVIGEWCNLGAGTSNSNIKNTAGPVKIWNEFKKKFVPAGLKCGLMMGDYSRAAINTSFNTGTVIGAASNVFSEGFPPTFIPSFSWGRENYKLGKALEHIHSWKLLKGFSLSNEEKDLLTNLYQSKK